jgi:membrane-bound serine protease (ClpP class)
MRKHALVAMSVAFVWAGLAAPAPVCAQNADVVPAIELAGTIDPATERWLDAALEDAERQEARFAIVRLDTPGGLDRSMRAMVRRITTARIPVVVYVAPNGARAASAGLFVLLASDVAAMAPQTNTGSATPVQLGGGETDEVLGRKIRNDATAYARALAEGHGRNADLAARMVRDAANVAAPRARVEGLIEVVAADQEQLLRELDGLEVRGPKEVTLRTEGVRIERREMPFHYEALQLLVNPTVASLLLLVGLAGIVLEVLSPGAFVPGIAGGIALVLGLYGTAQLPVTAAGVVLLILAIGLIAAETQVQSGGLLGLGGVAALVTALLVLYDTDSDVVRISVPAAVAAGVVFGGLMLFAAIKAGAVRGRPAHTGELAMIGQRGTVRTPLDPDGHVFVDGALWRAVSDNPAGLSPGTVVEVRSMNGLTLTVDAASNGAPDDVNEGEPR